MNKKHISLAFISTIILTVLLISLSFAWYQAEVINNAIDLASEGITIEFNTKTDNKLVPDVLKEGVYNGELPADYSANKSLYCYSVGNTLYITEKVRIKYVQYDTLTFNISMNYKGLEDAINALDYLNVKVYKSDIETTTPSGDGIKLTKDNSSVNYTKLPSGEYYLIFEISYKYPNEMLPADLLNSGIELTISAQMS